MKTPYLLMSVTTALCLTSCTTQLYVSNAVNAPLLREKHEFKLNVTSNDVQLAASLTDHVAVMANGYYQDYRGNNSYRHHGAMGEVGIGYYNALSEHFVFESYLGAGMGQVHKQKSFYGENNTRYIGQYNANAGKVFIQPDFGYTSKYFDVALTPRLSVVKYTNFNVNNYPQTGLKNDYLDNNRLTSPLHVFAEPAVTVRGGYKFIKLQAQYGLTLNMSGTSIRHAEDFASLGLIIDIARWYNN